MTKRHFQRGGRGVFTCATCGRATRETTQPSGSELCGDCDELAMAENSVLDGASIESVAEHRDAMVKSIVAKGGSIEKIRENFDRLWSEGCEPCTYPRCRCIVSTSTSEPEPNCPRGGHRP